MKVICISRGDFVSLRVGGVYHVEEIFSSTNPNEEYKLREFSYCYPSELFMNINEYRKQQIKKILNEINKN